MKRNQRGITLIALVVTIVVLLILAGVSISMLSGENGIIKQAQEAKKENNIESDIEKIQLSVNTVKMEALQNSDESLETIMKQELEGLFDEKINMSAKQEDGSYIIVVDGETYTADKEKVEYLGPGLRDKENVLVDSKDKILFSNTITKNDLKKDYPQYKKFEVIGISNEETGEFISTGSLEGKTGTLQIVGDITNLTFEYKLSKIMIGDETFFVKVKIDGEEKIQKLTVKQGEVVYYEEDVLEYTPERTEWFEVEGDIWTGGKGKKTIVEAGATYAETIFKFKGSKAELFWGQTQQDDGNLIYQMFDESGTALYTDIIILDAPGEGRYPLGLCSNLESNQVYKNIFIIAYNNAFDHYKTGYSSLVIDGIKIWK